MVITLFVLCLLIATLLFVGSFPPEIVWHQLALPGALFFFLMATMFAAFAHEAHWSTKLIAGWVAVGLGNAAVAVLRRRMLR